jgi:plastocyanin
MLTAVACGGGSSGTSNTPTNPTPPTTTTTPPTTPPVQTTTITITASGVNPQRITVSPGTRVTFVNSDRVSYDVSSGLDHNSRECPEIDAVGFLVAGQSRETSVFEQAKTCRFHEHANIGAAAYQGRIVVR